MSGETDFNPPLEELNWCLRFDFLGPMKVRVKEGTQVFESVQHMLQQLKDAPPDFDLGLISELAAQAVSVNRQSFLSKKAEIDEVMTELKRFHQKGDFVSIETSLSMMRAYIKEYAKYMTKDHLDFLKEIDPKVVPAVVEILNRLREYDMLLVLNVHLD